MIRVVTLAMSILAIFISAGSLCFARATSLFRRAEKAYNGGDLAGGDQLMRRAKRWAFHVQRR